MGSIRRAPRTGRWEVRYRDPTGRQRTKTFDTKADARAFLSQTETDMRQGEWTAPELGRTLVSEWATHWRATTMNLRETTRIRDEGYLDRYILPALGHLQLAQLTNDIVQVWVANLANGRPLASGEKAKKLAPATVVKAHQILGRMLDAAVDSGYIKASPCRKTTLPKVEHTEMRFLTPTEVSRLADAIHPDYRALVLVAAYGGLRIGELAGLRAHRVNLLRRQVEVAEILVELRGHITYGQPKTRAGRRVVTLPGPVADELAAHMTRKSRTGTDLVFTAPEGGPLRVPAWRRRQWTAAVKAADLAPLRPHDLRHTAVALWIAAGANLLEISRRAGHSSTSFTLDRYGHLMPDADAGLSDRLAGLYQAPAPAPNADVVPIAEAER